MWEYDEEPCLKCGATTRREECYQLGCDDGWITDLYESDPLWYDPDDIEQCSECHGYGWLWWCAECGADQYALRGDNPDGHECYTILVPHDPD